MEKNDLLQPSSVAEMAEKIKPCPDVSTASVSDNTSESLDRSDTSTTVSGDEFPPSKSPLSPSSSTEDMRQEPQDYQPKHSGLTAAALCLGWFMEIGACVLSLGSLVTIIVVLRDYDGKALRTLPWSITLNTFLAFFTTLTRVTFMVSVLEAISQWKWNLLKQSDRPFKDFLLVDSASRTVWGSILVLFRFHVKHIASIGALISLLGLITSPLTQQMIDYPLRTVADSNGTATVATAHSFNWTGTIDQELQPVLLGLIQPYASPVQPLAANCSSTNCTFPLYNSLAICSHVADVSHLLSISMINNSTSDQWSVPDLSAATATNGLTAWNASLPNGFSLVAPVPFAYFSLSKTTTLGFINDTDLQQTAISDLYLIWSNNITGSYTKSNNIVNTGNQTLSFHAVEIVHNLCVNKYQVNFTDQSSTSTHISSSYALKFPRDASYNLTKDCIMDPSGAILCDQDSIVSPASNVTLVDPDDDNIVYDASSLALIRLHLSEMLQGFVFYSGIRDRYDYFSLGDWFRGVALWGDVLDYAGGDVITDPTVQIQNIASYYDSIATALSNFIRSVSKEKVQGSAWTAESFVRIKWGWILLLAGQLLLSSILLLVTIVSTYSLRLPILKSAVLGPLLASTDELRDAIRGEKFGMFPDRNAKGENVVVRLQDNKIVLVAQQPVS